MALFGGIRDINLFRHFNKELLKNIIDIQIAFYKLDIRATKSNVYGEATNKFYIGPYILHCLIQKDEPSTEIEEIGLNVNQTIRVKFLRDDLIEHDIYPDIGDLIYWNGYYWQLNERIENQLFMNRNPQTNIGIGYVYGWNVSIIFSASIVEINKLNIVNPEN